MKEEIIILIPVFNDEASLKILLSELKTQFRKLTHVKFSFFIVNDGSISKLELSETDPIQILHLQRNIGHQKAIAVGLAYINENLKVDKVLIMDSDGEDRPEDAVNLVLQSQNEGDKIVFARRKSRQESSLFRLFYRFYKLFFYLLTGRKINVGNFLIMPTALLHTVVYYSEIWNHLAGGILKSGLPYTSTNTHRGKRYEGFSKMNFSSLLMHGLGAVAVFLEVIAMRLLIFSFILIAASIISIIALIGIRSFTNWAIPGWTSTVITAMLIVLLQSFLLSLFTIFLYLSSQSQRKFIPAHHYKDYMGRIETFG